MGSTDAFPLYADYPIEEAEEDGVLRSRSIGRQDFARLAAPPLRHFHVQSVGRSTADKIAMLAFWQRFRADWFTFTFPNYAVTGGAYYDRKFPVRFADPPKISYVAHDNYNIDCELVEAAGCALESGDYPDPTYGHPTVAVAGVVSSSDKIFVYAGYGFVYTGGGTLALDGSSVSSPKYDVPLGLHRLYVTGGSGTLAVIP